MARQARQKSEQAAFYHLFNRAAGDPRDLPFDRGGNARRFLSILEFYLCRLASFQLMGNHYHCVVQFEGFRPLSREELEEKARLRFGRRWGRRGPFWADRFKNPRLLNEAAVQSVILYNLQSKSVRVSNLLT